MKTPNKNSRKQSTLKALLGLTSILLLTSGIVQAKPSKGDQDRERPSPEEIASKIMEDFDANGDGFLSLEELQASIEARHERRGEGPPR